MGSEAYVQAALRLHLELAHADPECLCVYGDVSDLGFASRRMNRNEVRYVHHILEDFGKGSGHAAGLNYGDCFAYALARELGEPLLFKGDDFAHTDIPFVGRPAERRRLSELAAIYSDGTAGARGA